MSAITILLDARVSESIRNKTIAEIIEKFNLPLSPEQINVAFRIMRNSIERGLVLNQDYWPRYCYIMNENFNKNIKLFTAIILGLNNGVDVDIYAMTYFNFDQTVSVYTLGNLNKEYEYFIKLLNYCDFDVSNLAINDECKKYIKEYRDLRYGGNTVKSAVKIEQ
jgi:hypothetical protein